MAGTNYYADAIKSGHATAIARMKAQEDASNKYAEALHKQKEYDLQVRSHDLAEEHFHFDKANRIQNQISLNYPIGNPESDRQWSMLKTSPHFKELAKELKNSNPASVDDEGNIIRLPQYAAINGQLDAAVKQREAAVTAGTATPQQMKEYANAKLMQSSYQQAVELSKNDPMFSVGKNSEQQTQAISALAGSIVQSKVSQLQSAQNPNVQALGQQPDASQPVFNGVVQPAQLAQQPGSFNASVNPNAGALVQNPQPIQQGQPQGTQPNNSVAIPNYKILK